MRDFTATAAAAQMRPEDWDIESWFDEQCRLRTQKRALPAPDDPSLTRVPGPLRESIVQEFAFKSVSETYGTKALLQLADLAPGNIELDFLITQILDEARHAQLFRQHLVGIGFASTADIQARMDEHTAHAVTHIVEPLRDYFEKWVLHRKDFIAGLVIITVVLEGVLAPSGELGELKWRPFDQAAADLQAAANADELRHLCVCGEIVRRATSQDAAVRSRALECMNEGLSLWSAVPHDDSLLIREQLYQQGLEMHRERAQGHRLAPGLLLTESSPETRIELARQWTRELQTSRMHYMNLT
jgi:hypothetical protein